MNSIGSVWQKWDLHIHTPASYHWKGQRFEGQSNERKDELCKAVIDAMNATDVVAYCIMDYWHFDGYIALREYIAKHPEATSKKIFPGIEFRLVAPTAFRLNTHVLVSDEVPIEKLRVFVSYLQMAADNQPLTRQNFIDVAKQYDEGKLKEHGFKIADRENEEKMFLLGQMTVLITQESLKKAMEVVGRDNCLLIQPYGTKHGISKLKWKEHPYADTYLMKWADCFETRDQDQVELFLGIGDLTTPAISQAFLDNIGGYPKPVFSGSDAHAVGEYGVYPSERATWLKAQPTFKGLKQVCHEPPLRCHVGDRPPKLLHVEQNPTKYVKSLKLTKVAGSTLADEHWFDGKEIVFNPGLVAIIGNKGSGKSALADILALSGNSHCTNLEFLTPNRFRSGDNKSQHFVATLTWTDDKPVEVNLGRNADTREPQRIRYLPQHFIEDLCNEIATGNETNFEKELKTVIFDHLSEEKQLGRGSLDALLEYLIEARRQRFQQDQQTLRTLNETIDRKEQEISEDTLLSHRKAKALKQTELDAIDSVPLTVVAQPAENPEDEETKAKIAQIDAKKTELEELEKRLSETKQRRLELVSKQAKLNRLNGHVDNFVSFHETFVADHQNEFVESGFQIGDIVSVTINRESISQALIEVGQQITVLNNAIDGMPASDTTPATTSMDAQIEACNQAITALQDGLKAPERAHQEYLNEVNSRTARKALILGDFDQPETIKYFDELLRKAQDEIPGELTTLRDERRQLVRKLHAELLAIRDTYKELYEPVQKIASNAASATDSIQLEFDAAVVPVGFEVNFLDFIHRGRKGNFYGDDESKNLVRELLRTHDFDSTDSVVAFTDAVIKALTVVGEGDAATAIQIGPQLRDKKKVTDLYDYIFGLEYLEIRYNLRLGGKDISQLSPGEKGALLLVFYLLLDTEEIPIIIDQPEHNLDNESVVRLLVDCIRKARGRRQVFIVTHNPNLAVYCDADQIICCSIDKADGHRIDYSTGAIEDYDINSFAVTVLEGTYPAFDNRRKKWHKPLPEILAAVTAAPVAPTAAVATPVSNPPSPPDAPATAT